MATAVSVGETIVARVSEAVFSKIAEEHSSLWRHLAIQLAERLRQRSKFIKEPNAQPHIFIGSSRESLAVASKIQSGLACDPISVYLWTDDIFTASQTTIESLEAELVKADFAILVLASDDRVLSRGNGSEAPRDNVIFELGLFMGALTRARTFFVKPCGVDIKIPSDLFGVTPLDYDLGANSLDDVCLSVRKIVQKLGPK
jgi:predicted nucleotide-binding protein